MRMRGMAFMLLLTIGGCAWLHEQVPLAAHPLSQAPAGWAGIEIDRVAFAGPTLNFRVLVTAVDGGVVLDRRLTPNADIEILDAQDCDAGKPLAYFFAEYLPPEPGPSDLLELGPGEWFGQDMRFPIFIHQQDGGGIPDCVDATFVFRPEAAANGEVHFRVRGSLAPRVDAGERADGGEVPPHERIVGEATAAMVAGFDVNQH